MRRKYAALEFATLATVALSLGAVQVASAADMPMKAPAAVVAAPYNWSGFYVGATAGAAWGKADVTNNTVNGAPPMYLAADIPGINALTSANLKGTDFIFGGKLGYNHQWSTWVLGLEGDFSYYRFDETSNTAGNPFLTFAGGSASSSTNVKTDWLATIRPRLGYAMDRVLVYVTGGAAISKVSFSNTYRDFSPLGLGFGNEASSASKTKIGWALGGGLDYAITKNWIASIEYMHVDLGSIDATGTVVSLNATRATFNFSTKLKSDIARIGIAYKF